MSMSPFRFSKEYGDRLLYITCLSDSTLMRDSYIGGENNSTSLLITARLYAHIIERLMRLRYHYTQYLRHDPDLRYAVPSPSIGEPDIIEGSTLGKRISSRYFWETQSYISYIGEDFNWISEIDIYTYEGEEYEWI